MTPGDTIYFVGKGGVISTGVLLEIVRVEKDDEPASGFVRSGSMCYAAPVIFATEEELKKYFNLL